MNFQIKQEVDLNTLILKSSYTKKEVAYKLGISVQRLNQLLKEQHKMKFSALQDILSILGYTLDMRINKA